MTVATMPAMGRRRKNPNTGMEPRVYQRRGVYFYVHRTGKWERLGTDLEAANTRARLYNDPSGQYGTLVYWMELFLVDCEVRVKAKTLAQRTLDDYIAAIRGQPARPATGNRPAVPARPGALTLFFEPPMTPLDVVPAMVQDFLTTNAQLGRPVQANREKAALSSCFSWLIRTGKVPGLIVNPCLRASGIKRNEESGRERYVTHEEYRDVWNHAKASVRMMMALTYRTLQRPESDIINWDTSIITVADGRRVLRFQQGKTGKWMQVGIDDDLQALLRSSMGKVAKLREPLVRNLKGHAYTYDGLSSMLKKAIASANEFREELGMEKMPSFGFRDLKGKGATDMWLAKVPIEQIQALCGHEDKTTTEIYVKQRWRETVEPNRVAV